MRLAKMGDTVRVHYTGTLSDGTEFDSSSEQGPLELTIGSGQVFRGFESALLGMAAGETKNAVLPPREAYGAHDPENFAILDAGPYDCELQEPQTSAAECPDRFGHRPLVPSLI